MELQKIDHFKPAVKPKVEIDDECLKVPFLRLKK